MNMSNDQPAVPSKRNQKKQLYLTFTASGHFALESSVVIEVLEYKGAARIPGVPPCIAGIMNYHGAVIPAFDMRACFCNAGNPPTTLSPRRCVLIARHKSTLLGLVVDSVGEFVTINPNTLAPLPQAYAENPRLFLRGIFTHNAKEILVVDVDALVSI